MRTDPGFCSMELERPPCPACGSSAHEAMWPDVGPAGLGLHVVRCRRCGAGYLSPRPTPAALLELYASQDGDAPLALDVGALVEGDPRALPAPSWPAARVGGAFRFLALRRKIAAQLALLEATGAAPRAGERVLDLGCGPGLFLRGATRRFGCEAVGIDVVPARSGHKSAPSVHLIEGPVAGAALPERSFALVTAWSFLEHDPDPRSTLSAAHRWLRPGGHLVIEVPDAGAVTARLLGRDWPALEAPFHVCHYTRASLTTVVRSAGFEAVTILRAGTAAWQLFHSELLLGLLLRHRTHPAVRGLFHLERRSALARSALVGLSASLRLCERTLGLTSRMVLVARRPT